MSGWLLAFVAVIYALVAANYTINGNYGMGLAFLAYAVSNIGFIMAGSQ